MVDFDGVIFFLGIWVVPGLGAMAIGRGVQRLIAPLRRFRDHAGAWLSELQEIDPLAAVASGRYGFRARFRFEEIHFELRFAKTVELLARVQPTLEVIPPDEGSLPDPEQYLLIVDGCPALRLRHDQEELLAPGCSALLEVVRRALADSARIDVAPLR